MARRIVAVTKDAVKDMDATGQSLQPDPEATAAKQGGRLNALAGLFARRRVLPVRRAPAGRDEVMVPHPRQATFKISSWNLLRVTGATVDDLVVLIRREKPDLVLMQEASIAIDELPRRIGGAYGRAPLPGRIHGPAYWSAAGLARPARILPLPAGSLIHRVCQVLDVGPFSVANVHLSHGQLLNRRQLRRIAEVLPPRAAVLGDYNLLGPALLPGFRDVGPRQPTHLMVDLLPLRIDRCLVRGLTCVETTALPRGGSDHRPIVVHLALGAEVRKHQAGSWRRIYQR